MNDLVVSNGGDLALADSPPVADTGQAVDHVARLPAQVRLEGQDAKILNDFAAAVPEAPLQKVAHWYRHHVARLEREQAQADNEFQAELKTHLKASWGTRFAQNVQTVDAVIETLPPAVAMVFESARLEDGCPALFAPAVIKWLLSLGQRGAPAQTLSARSVAKQELEDIRAFMRKNRTAYNRNAGMQKRMRELLEAVQ